MRVTQVALRPTEASNTAGRPSLTPELLAATGARYSRSNDGLEAILAKIDPENPEKSVDSIFRMIDYGHQSIADMAPVALFMDGVSMWLAYHIWSLCPLAGGQESSTRYLKLTSENLPDAEEIGIPANLRDEWREAMENSLAAYETALKFWEENAEKNPEVTRIPKSLLEDTSEKAQKQVARMKRNYAFDRARYFLPAALKTNVMMVQSARAWVGLCQQLLSHPLPEPQKLGNLIRDELALAAPRLLKHAEAKESFRQGILAEWKDWVEDARYIVSHESFAHFYGQAQIESGPLLVNYNESGQGYAQALEFHDNRYAYTGPALRNAPVRFGWRNIAFGDIRDLNRHRSGSKDCLFLPRGFYGATDQTETEDYSALAAKGACLAGQCTERLEDEDWSFVYWILLGTQFSFYHTTTADKFIYEAELRTGIGAHYRYAQHLRDVLELWYQRFPETRGLILEGSAEPE